MGKRQIALIMAAIMAIVPVNGVMAEEILPVGEEYVEIDSVAAAEIDSPELLENDEIIAEETEYPCEITGAGQEGILEESSESTEYQGEDAVPEGELIVSGIEEVDTKNYVSPDENGEMAGEVTEVMEETEAVSECGWAYSAQAPVFRLFQASVYHGSYGAQLSGQAKEIYNAMKNSYATNHTTGNITIKFTTPITFETDYIVSSVIDPSTGEKKLSVTYDKNEDYMNSMIYAVQAAYDAFVYDHPEVFWISAMRYQVSISYTGTEGMHTGTLKIPGINLLTTESYTGAFREIGAFETSVAATVASIRQGLPGNATAVQTTEAIMNYLCDNLSYNEGTTPDAKKWAHSAAGVFLKDKNVVCEGYAKAYKILCHRLGVECVLIPGRIGATGEAHMWNAVHLEGRWYLVDVTWADTSKNREKYFLSGSLGLAGENRIVSTNFSGAAYTHIFTLPEISDLSYADQSHDEPHTHTFEEYIYNDDATCASNGTQTAYCTWGCGTKNTIAAPGTKLPHKFINYVSNHDASWYRDGTKTALCANGCGTKNTVADIGSAKIPTISLNVTSLVLKKGQSTTALKVSNLAAGDKVVSWKSANTNLVKVNSKTGKITAQKKTGTTKVTVTLQSGLSKSVTVKVQSSTVKTTKISGISKKLTIQKGKKVQLAPVITPITSQEKITYVSSNKKVAAVSSKGVITAKAAGNAKITVKSGSKKVTVTVTVPKITATKITGISKAVTLKSGKTKTLKPNLYPAGSQDTVKYSSSNKAVAVVSSKGKITAKKKGTAVITVKAGKAVAKCKVTVK